MTADGTAASSDVTPDPDLTTLVRLLARLAAREALRQQEQDEHGDGQA